jgi:heme/copper-type cytochrome/quinol oxidase subunit 1
MQERQRTVIVVATGLVLAVLAVAINRDLSDADAGWFAYAPNTGVTFDPGSSSAIWREAAIWLGAIAAWSGISLWLYRRPPRS